MDVVVRALIGGGLGALIALVANLVFLPMALKLHRQDATDPRIPKWFDRVMADGLALKVIYRVVMPVLFIGVFAFAATKLGEAA